MSSHTISGNDCLDYQESQAELTERPQAKFIDSPRLPDNSSNSTSPLSNSQDVRPRDDIFNNYGSSRQHQLSVPPSSLHDPLSPDGHCTGSPTSPGVGDFLESIFSLAWPDHLNPVSPTPQSPRLIEPLELGNDLNEPEDPEHVQDALLGFLSLDRNVESNSLPFILQATAIWLSHSMFEPLRIVYLARNDVFRGYVLGEEYRQIMNLMANNVYEITRSAEYGPAESSSFLMLEVILRRRLTQAGARVATSRGLNRQCAVEAMLFTNLLISLLCKVGSLSNLLGCARLAAPIFRRACPDPLEGLVNLPILFARTNTSLQFYSTVDVLLGVLTSRPMFFRYAVDFTPEVPESLFFLEDGPGWRWLHGVPDRLMMTFAQMNGLLEDFGPCVSQQVTEELEEEIKRMKPIIGANRKALLFVGRMVVQRCWLLAALIYLYMGLCGADSLDTRVVNVQARFMGILASVRPMRNPDSFLVHPMFIVSMDIPQ
ncbi:hypothetical protein RSAG8_04020, partial [Rhizoctonia solani AG-8 WAC10335]